MEQQRNDQSTDIDEVFEDLRGKLIQLDMKNVQSEKQSEEISRLLAEKKESFLETEKLKFINQDLEVKISILSKTAKHAESQKNEVEEKYSDLREQNEKMSMQNEKLSAANRELQSELSELQNYHSAALEKMTAWKNIQQEASARQTQNHLRMLDIARKIGHAKATSLYVHQLKEQLDTVYNSAFDTIKHLQDSRENIGSGASRPSPPQNNYRPTESQTPGKSDTMDASAKWRHIESYWKSVNETLRAEMQSYKEELWFGLQTLQQLSGNTVTEKSND